MISHGVDAIFHDLDPAGRGFIMKSDLRRYFEATGVEASDAELEAMLTMTGSPSRSALQTGRNPIHVNVQNVDPDVSNPDDPIGGWQGIPTNMTGIASVLRRAGYRCRPRHAPPPLKSKQSTEKKSCPSLATGRVANP